MKLSGKLACCCGGAVVGLRQTISRLGTKLNSTHNPALDSSEFAYTTFLHTSNTRSLVMLQASAHLSNARRMPVAHTCCLRCRIHPWPTSVAYASSNIHMHMCLVYTEAKATINSTYGSRKITNWGLDPTMSITSQRGGGRPSPHRQSTTQR